MAFLALLWNLFGVAMFFLQFNMSPETLAAIPADQRALYESTPAWVHGAFAVAVFGGALGSAVLLLKKRLALPLLLLSLPPQGAAARASAKKDSPAPPWQPPAPRPLRHWPGS